MKSKITDEDLLKALRGPVMERERALKAFFIDDPAPFDWVRKFVLRMNGTLEDAEEVFDDAVVSLDKNIQKQVFEQRSKLMSYFFTIAKNQWYLKYKAKHPTLPLSISEFELTEAPSSDYEGKEALYDLLDYGLEKLEEHQRDILKAKYHEQMSMKEIAATFELSSENIAKKYVDRFRGYLLDHIKRHPRYTQITKTEQ